MLMMCFVCLFYDLKTIKKLFSIISNLQTQYRCQLNFHKVDKRTGGKWLFDGTKHCKHNRLQSQNSLVENHDRYPGAGVTNAKKLLPKSF